MPRRFTINELMKATEMAYKYGDYGPTRWRREIKWLLDRGYSDVEVQCIMRSKYPRWAEETMRLESLLRWPEMFSKASIDELVAGYDFEDDGIIEDPDMLEMSEFERDQLRETKKLKAIAERNGLDANDEKILTALAEARDRLG